MKKETLDKGLDILRGIDFSEYRLKKLEERKKEYFNKGYFKIEGGFELDMNIPFHVFESWFDSEIETELSKIEVLRRELEEL